MNPLFDARPWQRLAEWTLPSESASTSLATENLAGAVQQLHLAEPLLARLKSALVEAMLNSIATDLRGQVKSAIWTRVIVSVRALPAQVEERGESAPQRSPLPKHVTTDLVDPLLPSWSFFLIERRGNVVSDADRTVDHLIELYLYQDLEESLHE